jgi:PAS domain S-box-containing protein
LIPEFDAEGAIHSVLGVSRDITERKRAEDELRESEERYRRITEAITDYIYSVRLTDGRSVKTLHGPGCLAVTGYQAKEFADDPFLWFRMVTNEDRPAVEDQVQRILAGEDPPPMEHRIIRKNGELRWVRNTFVPHRDQRGILVTYDGLVQDITERKRAEEENTKLQARLQQAQKMESLGNLAGGVAHDMNNVLGAILGLASANVEGQPSGIKAQLAFKSIIKAAERGGKVLKSLLNLVRKNPVEDREIDLNSILMEEVHLLERTTLAKVHIEMDLQPGLRSIRGDPNALTNALMNLCINAVDAMPANGMLTLASRNLDEGWVEILVKDTGCGMTKEVLEKAFDPFFTTKEIGKGTGLGLPLVYSTVQAHQGQIEIQSEPGRGTCVRILFPAYEPAVQSTECAVEPRSESSLRKMNVLLVDDDELIQSSMREVLDLLGHKVTSAQSGEEALGILEAGFQPDLVILDLNMPGLGGAGTMPGLRTLLPAVPVLLTTGRADQTAQDLVEAYPNVTMLAKPFTMRELQQHCESFGRSSNSIHRLEKS